MSKVRVRVDGKGVWAGTLGSPLVRWVVVLAVLFLAVWDGGTVFMTRMSLADTAQEAGRASAFSVSHMPLTTATAVIAYDAAVEVTQLKDGVSVRQSDFEVRPEGVALTVVRTSPSLVIGRVPWLKQYGVVEVSAVVQESVK